MLAIIFGMVVGTTDCQLVSVHTQGIKAQYVPTASPYALLGARMIRKSDKSD